MQIGFQAALCGPTIMTETQGPVSLRWLFAASILACASNVISVAGIDYQNYVRLVKLQRNDIASLLNIAAVESHIILLCPILVVVVARRSVPVVLTYAFVLFAVLAGRVYYLLPQSLTGVDGLSLKMDWSALLQNLLGVFSGIVFALWVIIRFVVVALKGQKELR